VSSIPTTPLETALLQPFTDDALEALRSRLFYAVTSDHVDAESARAIVQMAYETEVGASLTRVVAIAPGIAEELVPTRRRFLSIDADMVSFAFLYDPALAALRSLEVLPTPYVVFLESYVRATTPRYRMCGLSALLCFAAAHLGDL
jgi:hypothetical protein